MQQETSNWVVFGYSALYGAAAAVTLAAGGYLLKQLKK